MRPIGDLNRPETWMLFWRVVTVVTGAIVPICCSCLRVKVDGIYTPYRVDRDHPGASHGICPTCSERLYGKVLADIRADVADHKACA